MVSLVAGGQKATEALWVTDFLAAHNDEAEEQKETAEAPTQPPAGSTKAGEVQDSELKPAADLSALGQKWTVTEGNFHGTWIIHADSKVIEAFWEGPDHQQISDKLTLESFDGSTIVIYRESLKGRYQGKLSADGRHFIGTATWYPAGMTWSADIRY